MSKGPDVPRWLQCIRQIEDSSPSWAACFAILDISPEPLGEQGSWQTARGESFGAASSAPQDGLVWFSVEVGLEFYGFGANGKACSALCPASWQSEQLLHPPFALSGPGPTAFWH